MLLSTSGPEELGLYTYKETKQATTMVFGERDTNEINTYNYTNKKELNKQKLR